jgi:hypothetical protein
MFTFPLSSPIVAEGVKTITVSDPGYPNVTAQIYVKYKVTVSATPAPALKQASFIGGSVMNANGAASVGSIVLVNGVPGTGSTVQTITVTLGAFAFAYNFPNRGNYYLVLSNTANTAVYQQWSLGGNIVATTVLDPNPLYAMSSVTQESYMYLSYEDGTPVTGASISLPGTGSVNLLFTASELGGGFYKFSGLTSATAGNNYYTITSGGLTISYTLYFKPLSAVWNPVVKIVSGLTNYGPGGTLVFSVDYGVGPSYQLNDYYTAITGPGKQYSSSGTFYIEYGGQVKLDVMANLWYDNTTTDLTAKPVDVEQVFTVNPVIQGDQVTIGTTKVNKGDTKDITVTVKMANGVERNNAKVVLSSTVLGMFSAPAGAIYTVSGDGKTVTLDASGTTNYNIVGGNYVFAGLTFNHRGYISVEVDGTDSGVTWTTAKFLGTNSYNYGIRVYPQSVTLTADITKFTAGVAYPVVNVSGAVAGLTGWSVYNPYSTSDVPTFSYVDNGNGSYVFNFSTMHYAFGSLTLYSYDSTGDIQYKITFKVVMPTLTFTSANKDGLITDNFAEDVKLQVTDPATGNPIIPSSVAFVAQHIASSPMFDNGDPYLNELWDPGIVTAKIVSTGTYSYDVSTNTVEFNGLKATKGNPYVDYTENPATLYLSYTVNGVDLWFMDALKVTPAQLTVTPKDLVLYYNQSNMFSVKALDAHGAAIAGADVYGTNPYQTSWFLTYQLGGITGSDGVVAFSYTPNYIGEIAIQSVALGLVFNTNPLLNTALIVQIVPAPADTTPPTVKITAPADGSTVSTSTVTVTGSATDAVGVVGVYLNGASVTLMPDGSFNVPVTLVEGANTITVTAFDKAGNKGTATVTVTYTKPVVKQTVVKVQIGSDIMTVNGKVVQLDAAPEIVNGRTFLPLRAISEALGATVDYIADTQGITVVLGTNTIGLQIGNTSAVVNGTVMTLDAPPYIKNSRTMVPLRVIAEGLGAQVEWDPALRVVTITLAQ